MGSFQKKKVIVVGAGAAGLMAAGQAGELGAEVLVLEKMPRIGLKLRITGKGRCNLTNIAPLEEFIDHFGPNGQFLRQVFARFFSEDLIDFFKGLGLKTVTERGGRVFPASDRASEVVSALANWVSGKAKVRTNCAVNNLIVQHGQITGVVALSAVSGEQIIPADRVIIATGGASYPATGSTGDGYRLAQSVGHRIVPIRPALVPLETSGDVASRLQGLSLRNVGLKVMVDGKKAAEAFGEMVFTHFGVSGPIVLDVSKHCVDALRAGQSVTLSIDLKPALDEKKLDLRLLRDLDQHGRKKIDNLLKGLLPQKLIPVCAELAKIDLNKPGHQLTAEERKRLGRWLKDFRLQVTGHRDWKEAIITAGGVDVKQIDPRTMKSRLVKGLYFAGEVLDIDADTGGYNLQAAFSTGWLAGRSAAEE